MISTTSAKKTVKISMQHYTRSLSMATKNKIAEVQIAKGHLINYGRMYVYIGACVYIFDPVWVRENPQQLQTTQLCTQFLCF